MHGDLLRHAKRQKKNYHQCDNLVCFKCIENSTGNPTSDGHDMLVLYNGSVCFGVYDLNWHAIMCQM